MTMRLSGRAAVVAALLVATTAAATPAFAVAPAPLPVLRAPEAQQVVQRVVDQQSDASSRSVHIRTTGPLISNVETNTTRDVANMRSDTNNETTMTRYWASLCAAGGASLATVSCLLFFEEGQQLYYSERMGNDNIAAAQAIESYADYWAYWELVAVAYCVSGGPCDP